MRGQLVRELINGAANAGSHQVVWNGKNESGQMIASGLYFCRIEVTTKSKEHKTNIEVKKMIFMK
jgi:flagellar hook assembly protein FlgD